MNDETGRILGNHEVPRLNIIKSEQGHGYILEGWYEFRQWATYNNPLFYAVMQHSRMTNLQEVDMLKLLVRHLVASNEDLIGQLVEERERQTKLYAIGENP